MLFSAINYAAVAGGLAVLYPITAAPVAILSSAAADTAASSVQKRDWHNTAIEIHNYGSIHYFVNPTNIGEALPMTQYGGSRVYFSHMQLQDDDMFAMLSNTQGTPVWMSVGTAKPEGSGPFEVTWQRQSSETSTPIAWDIPKAFGEIEASIHTVDGRKLDWWCYRESDKTWLIFDSTIKFPENCQGVNFHVDFE